MDLDHAVLWVKNAKKSLDFYVSVVGLEPVRSEEFKAGKARFPSVRINDRTVFDIMERSKLLTLVQKFTGSKDNIGGFPVNHLCISMSESEYEITLKRLGEHGVELKSGGEDVFGARGQAVRSTYFNDLDDNVIEVRFYK